MHIGVLSLACSCPWIPPSLPSCWHLGMHASAAAGTPKQEPLYPNFCIQSLVQTCAGRIDCPQGWPPPVIVCGMMKVCVHHPNEEALCSELLRLRLHLN